jgi:hypothetical protein
VNCDHFEWRYLRGGAVVHALRAAHHMAALCGVGPWTAEGWYGTGTQREYERAAQLRRCRHCVARIVTGAGGGHG